MLYKKGYKYQTCSTESIFLGLHISDGGNEYVYVKDGFLYIRRGYAWDGLTCAPDTKRSLRASLIHDALYQLLRENLVEGLTRLFADELFYHILVKDKFSKFVARIYFSAVRRLAKNAAESESSREILRSP